jgi:hypothetical protein
LNPLVFHCALYRSGAPQDETPAVARRARAAAALPLPAMDELQRLFGGPSNRSGHRVTGPIHLTGWRWRSSFGREQGEQRTRDFGDGGRASVVMGDCGLNRAVCVRRPQRQM